MKKKLWRSALSLLLALALLFAAAPRFGGQAAASEELHELIGPDDEVLEETNYDGTRLGMSLMLYHIVGEPETDLSVLDRFIDLEDCTEAERAAIAWAFGNGITSSMTSNTFSPYSSITKAQAVFSIWKTKGAPEPTTTENSFVDLPKPSNWAYSPILWAIENTDWLDCYEQDSNYFEPHRVVNQMILYKCLTDGTMLWKLSIIPVPYPTSGSCGDNLTWSFDSETGVLTIEGTGAMWDTVSSFWHNFSSNIRAVSLPEGLTSIGAYAFSGCSSLTSVTIPASVTRLYGDAFKACDNLRATIVRNPDCWVQEKESGDLDSEEDLYLYPSTLGTKECTIVYGKHDAELENAPAMSYDRAKGRYPENYAKTYGYTFYATNVFSDVAEGKWYEIPVAWAYGKGITSGTGNGKFSPNATCTREQIATFIWKAYDSPEAGGTENPFTDVNPEKYYAPAVLWAYYHEPQITGGMNATTFGVGKPCTRAQVVTFLYAAAGKPEPTTTENPFTDVKETDYFYKAVLWAVENGITSGVSPTSFAPKQTCTRAQVVTFLYKAVG